jgi:hypothetical protein
MTQRRALTDTFSTAGNWRVSDDASRLVAGSLSYSPEKIEIRFLDHLRPLKAGALTADHVSERYPVIYGLGDDGNAVSAFRCLRSNMHTAFGALSVGRAETVVSPLIIVGAEMAEDTPIAEVEFRVPGLLMWNGEPTIHASYEQNHDGQSAGSTYRVIGKKQEDIRLSAINATFSLFTEQLETFNYFSATVTSSCWWKLRPDQSQPLQWYFEQAQKVGTLLTFLAGTPMSFDCMRIPLGGARELAYVLFGQRDARYCAYQNTYNFLVARPALKGEFGQILANWFERYPKVQGTAPLAQSVLSSEKLWQHVEFLSLMQALEGFHRAVNSGTYMKPEDYENVAKDLIDAIPAPVGSDHRAALKSKIKYGNEYSLRKRLNELVSRMPESMRQLILGRTGKIPQQWVDTRNYYTHWDEELRAGILSPVEMLHVNLRLRHLLRSLYLMFAGAPDEVVAASLVGTHDEAQWLIQINASERRAQGEQDTSDSVGSYSRGS